MSLLWGIFSGRGLDDSVGQGRAFPWAVWGVLSGKGEHKDVRRALRLDQTEGPPSPALCSHTGQPALGQGPTRQDMVQQHPPIHVPQLGNMGTCNTIGLLSDHKLDFAAIMRISIAS